MTPKKPPKSELDIFRSRLENIINMRHPLVRLAQRIDWDAINESCGKFFCEKGRPALPTRLLVGLHLIKHMEALSDEAVCAGWVVNPYQQYFCGYDFFQHELVLDRSSMSRWRKRVGTGPLEALLAETLRIALETEATTTEAFERVTVDTTVQTKAIAHPSDAQLLLRAIQTMCRMAKAKGIKLRQSFLFVAKDVRIEVSRLLHKGAHKQAMRNVRKLRTFTGRLCRDIGRKIAGQEEIEATFAEIIGLADRLIAQRKDSKKKVYSVHAPEVECIAKGKARTKYEFGVKASIATTNARTKGGQFIVGMMAIHGNPYDGHTLQTQLDQVERVTGVAIERAFVDLGYRAHDYKGEAEIFLPRDKNVTSPAIKRERKRRSAIEPVIGHLKSDGLLERNRLKGKDGDAINAILCAVGHNLRLLLAWLKVFWRALRRYWENQQLMTLEAA